jgi:hypothetical protein
MQRQCNGVACLKNAGHQDRQSHPKHLLRKLGSFLQEMILDRKSASGEYYVWELGGG